MPDGANNALLESLAHPTLVNPLAAYSDANKVAAGVWENRRNQADQAAGQAYQQATDPVTGQVDAGRAQALLALNPQGALSAQRTATSGQALQTANTAFNQQQQAAIGKTFGSVLTLPDAQQTPDNYQKALDYTLANHGITQDHYNAAKQALAGAGNDPASLRQFGTRLLVGTLAGPEMANTVLPTNQTTVTGPTSQPQVRQAPVLGGAVAPAPGATTIEPSPDTVFTAPPAMVPDTRPGAAPNTYTPVPRTQPGAPPATGAGGPPPIPGTDGYTPPQTAGYKMRGGAPTPAAGAAPDAIPGPDPTKPLPGYMTPPAASSPTAAPTPQQQTYLAPPAGGADTLKNDLTTSFAASQAIDGQQKRAIAGESALQALQLARTGPGTATEAQYTAFLEAHGMTVPPVGGLSSTDYRQLLKKNLLRFAQSAGSAAGTDFQLTEKLASNANVDDMTKPANEHVLVQDLGILRRDMAQTQMMPQPSGDGAVANHIKTFPTTTDPRAFSIDYMQPEERAALLQEAAKQGPNGKIYKSLKMAHDHGHIAPP